MRKLFKFKSWYTLEESAQRLSLTLSEAVTEADVVQLASEGIIEVCWFLKGDHLARQVTLNPTLEISNEKGEIWAEYLSGLFKLPMDICPSWGWWLLTFIGKGGASGDLCGPIVVDSSGATWELVDPNGKGDFFQFPTKDEVVVTADALAAFEMRAQREANNQTLAVGDEMRQFPSLGEDARDTLLKQIATLAILLSEKSNTYTRGGKPNASQIADTAVKLLDALPDAKVKGLASSTIRNNITAGLKLIAN